VSVTGIFNMETLLLRVRPETKKKEMIGLPLRI